MGFLPLRKRPTPGETRQITWKPSKLKKRMVVIFISNLIKFRWDRNFFFRWTEIPLKSQKVVNRWICVRILRMIKENDINKCLFYSVLNVFVIQTIKVLLTLARKNKFWYLVHKHKLRSASYIILTSAPCDKQGQYCPCFTAHELWMNYQQRTCTFEKRFRCTCVISQTHAW